VRPESPSPIRVVLDTDAGVDDAVAVVLAANSPEVELLAITTVGGNAPVHECTRNCLLLAELLWPEAPPIVAEGARAPLARELLTAPEVHGPDGLGGELGSLPPPSLAASPSPAQSVLIDTAARHPGEITLVATGPLTNIATALRADPGAIAKYRRIVVMGGAFRVPGNTGPVAEFNFYVDPEAADQVMNAGLDVTLVPLDATTRSPLARADVVARPLARPPVPRPGHDLARVLSRALDCYMRRELEESGLDGGYMHDPLAVASAFVPGILTTSPGRVRVLTEGADRGRSTLASGPQGPSVEVALDLDREAFQAMLAERVLAPTFGG
jgi:inosine-uridine nucleoside N-ribohydrolase